MTEWMLSECVAAEAAVSQFLSGVPTGPGPACLEYIARTDVRRMGAVPSRKCAVYEFPWGFITEEHGVWNFYARSVWRAGTSNYADRFTAAWEDCAEPALLRAMQLQNQQFYISFDDGVGIFGCISLACVLGSKGQRMAREWLAQDFLPKIWPRMLGQVLHSQPAPYASVGTLSWNSGIMPDALQSYMARSATFNSSAMVSPSRG